MKAIVIYESHWGNTAAIARAIAEGIGPEARALSTAEAISAAKTILGRLEAAGRRPAATAERFIVKGKYGPLRDGELERAKAWGAALAHAME